jgi:hypothetical protein
LEKKKLGGKNTLAIPVIIGFAGITKIIWINTKISDGRL